MELISSDVFADVCEYDGFVYAVLFHQTSICVYETQTWELIRTINASSISDCDLAIESLRVTSHGIALACAKTLYIYVLDHSGELQQTYCGEHFDGFFYPRLCSTQSDDSLLVADPGYRRLQVLYDGKWLELPIKIYQELPSSAVVTSHALYISSFLPLGEAGLLQIYKIT